MMIRSILLSAILVTTACKASDLATLPPELDDQFQRAVVSEYGYFTVDGKHPDELLRFLTSNWSPLLTDIGTIEDPTQLTSAAAKIGAAAEELPPLEYLDFLKEYLDLYEARRFPNEILGMQLGGRGRKDSFLSVNYEHPQVQILLARARQLLPKEDDVLQSMLEKMANGTLADNYRGEVSNDTPPPETLPGIKLRRPWASFIDRVKPSEHPHPATRGNGSMEGSDGGRASASAESRDRPGWAVLSGAILLLLGAIYIFFSQKAKVARQRRS